MSTGLWNTVGRVLIAYLNYCELRYTSEIAILMIANCQAGNILLIEYSFSCDSFYCELWKNSQFAIKRISQSKPDLRYNSKYSSFHFRNPILHLYCFIQCHSLQQNITCHITQVHSCQVLYINVQCKTEPPCLLSQSNHQSMVECAPLHLAC